MQKMNDLAVNFSADSRLDYYWRRLKNTPRRYGAIDPLIVETLLNFIFTYELISARLSSKAREYGLTRAGLNVLMILTGSEGKGCQHHQISKLLLVSRANVTGLIDSLIRQGLVERAYDEQDRRVCIARISPKGERLLDVFLPVHHREIERIFFGLNHSKKKSLNQLLEQMRAGFCVSKKKK